MSRVLGWAKVSAWAIVIGLATSSLLYRTDGRGAGVMITAACALLMWRIVVTIGLPDLKREARSGSPTGPRSGLDGATLTRSM